MPLEILFFPEKCLKSLHRASTCRLCHDVCPTNAIDFIASSLRFDPLKCVACTACIAICPMDVFESKPCSEQTLMQAIEEKRDYADEIIFTCKQIQTPPEHSIALPCLARIEASALLSCLTHHTRSIKLIHGACDKCHSHTIPTLLQKTVAQTEKTLHTFEIKKEIILLSLNDYQEQNEQTINGITRDGQLKRRLFLTLFGKKESIQESKISTSHTRTLFQENLSKNLAFKKYRRLMQVIHALYQRGKNIKETAEIGTKPAIDFFTCKACSICTKVCPSGALHLGEEENLHILFAPKTCIECHLCADVCHAKAISFVPKTIDDLLNLDPKILFKEAEKAPHPSEPRVAIYRT